LNLYSDEIYTSITKKDPNISGCELEEFFIENGLHQHYNMRDLIEIVQKKIDINLESTMNKLQYMDSNKKVSR